ncbi:MAG: TolB family protein, partial [Thermocrispum sp.]
GQLWLPIGRPGSVELAPVEFDGTRTGPGVRLPAGFWAHSPDGRGGIVVGGVGGEYLANRSGVRRISSGSMMAVGPSTFVVQECDESAVCRSVVIDRDSGSRRVLRTAFERYNAYQSGVISPDGRTAAITGSGSDASTRLFLLDLTSGKVRAAPDDVQPTPGEGAPVWSPDGRWLITVSGGDVVVVDPATGRGRSLALGLVSADAVAVRG